MKIDNDYNHFEICRCNHKNILIFSSDHFAYVKHDCPAPNTRDVQVPQCPLCGAPVPGKRGEPPDVAVEAHIDNQCMSDPARERRNKVNNYAKKFKIFCQIQKYLCFRCGINNIIPRHLNIYYILIGNSTSYSNKINTLEFDIIKLLHKLPKVLIYH